MTLAQVRNELRRGKPLDRAGEAATKRQARKALADFKARNMEF